jgi:predicted O-methyltransferase YrrM
MMEYVTLSGVLRQLGDRLLTRTPILEKTLRAAFNRLPGGFQTRLRNERLRMRFENGWMLVPEKDLTRKYVEALRWIIDREGRAAVGDYLEFGVFMGTSLACFWRAVQKLELTHVRLFGFDSFAGLPESARHEDDGYWMAGNYSSRYEETRDRLTRAGVDWKRVFLVKGWFAETARPELAHRYQISMAGVVMIDCDLYSSSVEALRFCGPLIQGSSVVLFDDWFSGGLAEKNLGEKRAFQEFLSANPRLTCEDFGTHGNNSRDFKLCAPDPAPNKRPNVSEPV